MREAPASFDDHFSQPRLFWLSLSPVEREHVIAAYTFELSKVYEPVIRERVLTVLAEIDPVLCAEVATGLGLPAPQPSRPLPDVVPSPALSQAAGTWPTTGRVVGIVADATSDLDAVRRVRDSARQAGLLPLLIAPTGAPLADDLPAQRTFAATRSVEYDALVVAGPLLPAADDHGARDAKSGVTGPRRPGGFPRRPAGRRGLPARQADRRAARRRGRSRCRLRRSCRSRGDRW
ncbi:catalase-related domain-containing protein [Kitasatospora indigofera]|uniref:catalase-related domain-containing protein n=1 Tax=Kitasatospora indigofera TaxID=67307 RepID=UPI0036384134